MKAFFIAALACSLWACQTKPQHEAPVPDPQTIRQESAKPEVNSGFFVLTKWRTTDRLKALSHLSIQKKQLFSLWKENIIDNVYYQPDVELGSGKPMSLSAFVIKGRSERDVRRALHTTDVIKRNLATYTIIPVGDKVFGRSDKSLKLATTDNTYVVIWAFLVERDKLNAAALTEQGVVNEHLHRQGILENAYINLKQLNADSTRTQPAIFFINAKSEKAAKNFLDKMPLVTAQQATYSLHNVGKLLLGTQD